MFEWTRQLFTNKTPPSVVSETLIAPSVSTALSSPDIHWPASSFEVKPELTIERDKQMVSSPVALKTVTNASVYLTGGRHAVASSAGDLISHHRVSASVLADLPWQTGNRLSGRTLLLGNSAGAACYYHWMMDLLPKLGYLQKAGIDLNSIDHFLVREISSEFQRETLSLLGIDSSRITECANHPFHLCDELLVLNLDHNISFGMNPFVPRWVKQMTQTEQTATGNHSERIKLYITRPEGVRRSIENEAELIDLLKCEGFVVSAMENLSVREQAALLGRTDLLIAAHGGALTNMVFAKPGTQIIELFGSHVYPYYYGLANLCKHHYRALMQGQKDIANLVQLHTALKSGTAENQRVSQNAGFSVDVNALTQLLNTASDTAA